jgi:putative transposase
MKFGFIAKHRSVWPVARLCEALGVPRSGFHNWLKRGPWPEADFSARPLS